MEYNGTIGCITLIPLSSVTSSTTYRTQLKPSCSAKRDINEALGLVSIFETTVGKFGGQPLAIILNSS
jgi:hypothetical protein